MNIYLTSNPVTNIVADAIVCPIPNDRFWFSETDNAIRNIAESLFHQQIPDATMRHHGDTFLATRDDEAERPFSHVLFVVDEGAQHATSFLMYNSLARATADGLHTLSIPKLRENLTYEEALGVMLGISMFSDHISRAAAGVEMWNDFPKIATLESITFSTHDNPIMEQVLCASANRAILRG